MLAPNEQNKSEKLNAVINELSAAEISTERWAEEGAWLEEVVGRASSDDRFTAAWSWVKLRTEKYATQIFNVIQIPYK